MSDMDQSMLAAMGISGFGKTAKKRALDPTRFDKNKRDEIPASNPNQDLGNVSEHDSDDDDNEPSPSAPAKPKSVGLVPKQEQEYDASEEFPGDEEYEGDKPDFPITHVLSLKSHTKPVSALTVDPSGARVLSGAHDYEVKLWDFGGMSWSDGKEKDGLRPFKSWEPAGSYHIHDLKFSHDGQKFLVISGTTQAKLYDREGEEQATFVKGDMYIRDMRHTSGHVHEITSCAWHPKNSQQFITSSADSTIRIWDVENKRKQKTVIVIKSKERGARTKVTSCAWSPDASMIAGACLDGALHIYSTKSNYVRPNLSVYDAHAKNTETGSVVFSVDGRTLLTRGGSGDNTVKLWDIRSFRKALASREGLTTLYPQTNAVFSPDEKHLVTCAASDTKGGQGHLVFLSKEMLSEEKTKDTKEMEIVQTMDMPTNPIKVCWHSKINQILVGLSNGAVDVLYSPLTSTNGAKLVMSKGPARKVTIEDMSYALTAPTIIAPHALPSYRDRDDSTINVNAAVNAATAADALAGGWGIANSGLKRKRDKDRLDPRKSRRPELPVTGPGKGGRVGASATQHVVQNLVRDTTRDEDPREALLRYAKVSEEDPQWTGAWKTNQPKPVFQQVDDTEKEKEE